MSSLNFFIVVDYTQLQIDLNALVTAIEETATSPLTPLVYTIYTITGHLSFYRAECKVPWKIELTEEGIGPFKLDSTAKVTLLVEWVESGIGMSPGTDGYIPVYLSFPDPDAYSDL